VLKWTERSHIFALSKGAGLVYFSIARTIIAGDGKEAMNIGRKSYDAKEACPSRYSSLVLIGARCAVPSVFSEHRNGKSSG